MFLLNSLLQLYVLCQHKQLKKALEVNIYYYGMRSWHLNPENVACFHHVTFILDCSGFNRQHPYSCCTFY